MKKIIFVLFILLLPFVMAESSFFYKQGDVIDLKVACSNNGAPCSGSSECNLSVFYPNGTTFVNQQTMTNSGDYHNYTLNSSSVPGQYSTNVFCCDGSECEFSGFFFEINTRGTQSKPLMVGIYVVLIILIVLFFYLSTSLKIFSDDYSDKLLRIYLFFLGFAHILATIYITYLDYNDFEGISGLLIVLFTIDVITLLLLVYLYFVDKAEDAVDKAIKTIDKELEK